MQVLKIITFTVLLFPIIGIANINFSADSLILEFPSTIIASGNTKFKEKDIDILANRFSYDTQTMSGTFERNVIIHYRNSTLQGNSFSLDIENKSILGNGNIVFITPDIKAYSDYLIIEDYEVLKLKKNVLVERNGSQIKTNELMYNLKTDTILSNERVKLIIED